MLPCCIMCRVLRNTTREPVNGSIAYPRDMSFGIRCCTVVSNCSMKQCVSAQLPIPWNTLYTVDFINEMTADHVCPEGVLTFQDLGVDPRPVRGFLRTSADSGKVACFAGSLCGNRHCFGFMYNC